MKYSHVGIPTTAEKNWAGYLDDGKVHYSDFENDPYGLEWLKFDTDSPMPEVMRNVPHVAFEVDDLNAAIEGKEVLLEPFCPFEGLRCAFILHNGAPIEFMQKT
jgi:hypothetical protein